MEKKSKVKKVILLSGLIVAMLCSCMSEDTEGCPAMRNLVFSHYCVYDPDESFDNMIANDVLLCTYHNNKIKEMKRISYADIRDRKIYSYRKQYGGNVQIAAWAVPAGSLTQVPQWNYDDDFYEQCLEGELKTRAALFTSFVDDLYLGTVVLTDDNSTVETTHEVRMIDVACRTWITVDDQGNKLNDPSQTLYALVNGTMSGVNLLYQGIREEAGVYAALSKGSDGLYSTGYFGTLPSAETQRVSVSLYYGNNCVVTVQVDEKAVSGGRIIMNITLGTSDYVNVYINGFEVIPSEVKWM